MTTRRSLRLVASACAAGLIGVACGSAGDTQESAAPVPAVESTPDDAAADDDAAAEPGPAGAASDSAGVVPPLLQFTAPLIGGGEIVGDELAGKPTAFWFWSPT